MVALIEPNIHPVLVHFAFALTASAAASYVLAALVARWRATLQSAADWMLAFAALAVTAAVAAGFQAYYSVAHDAPSHIAMTTHRNWAVPSALVVLAVAAWRWRARTAAPSRMFVAASIAAAALLTVTAWWGGRLVYGYGLGVASLPAAAGDGHDHSHEAPAGGQPAGAMRTAAPDSPEGVVDAFAAALRAGDEAALRRLAAPEVVIAESGGVERSFEEYAGHHMPADMAFTAAVRFTLEQRDVMADADMATVISRSQARGEFRGRPVRARMMETMVLRRADGQWRITHIHWSSAPISDEHEH